jgi:hypothetical protein
MRLQCARISRTRLQCRVSSDAVAIGGPQTGADTREEPAPEKPKVLRCAISQTDWPLRQGQLELLAVPRERRL